MVLPGNAAHFSDIISPQFSGIMAPQDTPESGGHSDVSLILWLGSVQLSML